MSEDIDLKCAICGKPVLPDAIGDHDDCKFVDWANCIQRLVSICHIPQVELETADRQGTLVELMKSFDATKKGAENAAAYLRAHKGRNHVNPN